MRLIDADELIKDRVSNDPVVIAAKCAPTVYDVDKIMERLEEHFNVTDNSSARLAYHHAIGIVKAGGIE